MTAAEIEAVYKSSRHQYLIVLRYLLRSSEDAEEALQMVFVKLLEKSHEFGPADAHAYIGQAVRNMGLDMKKKRDLAVSKQQYGPDIDLIADPRNARNLRPESWDRFQEIWYEAMAALDARPAAVTYAHYRCGLMKETIADFVGATARTVQSDIKEGYRAILSELRASDFYDE